MNPGKIWMSGGGGGADLDVITVTDSSDVVAGKVIVDKEGNPLTGTLELTGTAQANHVLAPYSFYNTNLKKKETGGIPSISADNADQWGALNDQVYTNGTLYLKINPWTYYQNINWVRRNIPNLRSNNIRSGVKIGTTGDLVGTMVDYSYLAVGQTSF